MSRPANAEYPCYWMYIDNQSQWRWTYFGDNGEEIGVSSESYVNKADCRRGVDIMRASKDSKIYEQKT